MYCTLNSLRLETLPYTHTHIQRITYMESRSVECGMRKSLGRPHCPHHSTWEPFLLIDSRLFVVLKILQDMRRGWMMWFLWKFLIDVPFPSLLLFTRSFLVPSPMSCPYLSCVSHISRKMSLVNGDNNKPLSHYTGTDSHSSSWNDVSQKVEDSALLSVLLLSTSIEAGAQRKSRKYTTPASLRKSLMSL